MLMELIYQTAKVLPKLSMNFFITNATKITKDIPRQSYSEEARESNVNDCSQFSLHPVTLEFVIKEIDHLCQDKATGEDGISCKILKLSKHVIAQSLTDIINMSLFRGVVPCAWKRARVVPIFKSGVAFVDLRKAFDTVDHEVLISKLTSIGCTKESIKWFKSYVSDREQITYFKGNKSNSLMIKMGVPQGSILGPLLFSIYVDSMPNCTSNGIIDMYV